jgi:transaldolase
MADLNTRISDFVWKDILEKHVNGKSDPFWKALQHAGSELWLDTGDMAEAEAIWSSEMSALTTNNSLLNHEIQKGIYDVFISESKAIVRDLPQEERVKEIAFILNARHGLRLAQKFRGYVSVELHTDTAHDIKAIFNYGKRYHEICPEQFIVKVPLTAEGLIGARMLKDAGVKVNVTLGFSARQNVLITRIARPDYVNVFLGRIGSYMIDNKLGDGSGAGEMAVIASQNWVTGLSAENPWQTKQIAASIRHYKQIEMLAGIDVITMPPKVAVEAQKHLKKKFTSRTHENYEVSIFENAEKAHIDKFWKVDNKVQKLSAKLAAKVPQTTAELIHLAHSEGCEDMFPFLTKEEKGFIASDGKIPVHSRWEKKIAEEKIAPDTLLTLAGLASFTADQQALDERIRGIIEM